MGFSKDTRESCITLCLLHKDIVPCAKVSTIMVMSANCYDITSTVLIPIQSHLNSHTQRIKVGTADLFLVPKS